MPTPPPKSSRRTPRRRNIFRERDIRRAIRAAQMEGVEQIQIDSETGTITLHLGDSPKDNGATTNSWDEVLTDAEDAHRAS